MDRLEASLSDDLRLDRFGLLAGRCLDRVSRRSFQETVRLGRQLVGPGLEDVIGRISEDECERLDDPAVCYRADCDSAPTSVGVGPRTGCSTLGGTATRAFPSEEEESRIARFSPGKWGPRSGVKQSALISHRLVSLAHDVRAASNHTILSSYWTCAKELPGLLIGFRGHHTQLGACPGSGDTIPNSGLARGRVPARFRGHHTQLGACPGPGSGVPGSGDTIPNSRLALRSGRPRGGRAGFRFFGTR